MKRSIPYRYRVQLLLFFLLFITYLDRVTISLVGVRIKSAFGLSNQQFGWVLSAFALAYALFEIPAGILGDRIGQRKMLLRIVTGWSLFTALTGTTTGLMSLIITRFLFGVGEAGAFPNSTAVISRWFPATETSRGMSALMIGINTGAALAPLIVVPIAIAYDWRAPFFVNGLIGLVWILICYWWFRNDPIEMKGISIEEINLIRRERKYVPREKTFPWRDALRSRSIWAMGIAFFCSQWGLYFFVAWMPIYLQQGRHFSEGEMKIIMTFVFVAGISGAFAGGFVSDWLVRVKGLLFGRRFVGFGALAIMGLCFTAAAMVTGHRMAAVLLITANGFFMAFPVAAFSTCTDIGGTYSGTVAGLMNGCGQTGAVFIAIVFGKIVDSTRNFNTPLWVIAAVLIAGSLLWLLIDPSKKLAPDREKNATFSVIPNTIQSS